MLLLFLAYLTVLHSQYGYYSLLSTPRRTRVGACWLSDVCGAGLACMLGKPDGGKCHPDLGHEDHRHLAILSRSILSLVDLGLHKSDSLTQF